MDNMIRRPAVSGQFYESSPSNLTSQVHEFITEDVEKENAIGLVSPHAGLVYSGEVAGAVYSRVRIPQTFIILGPNHTGMGSPVSLMSSGKWEMPTGDVRINDGLAAKLKQYTDVFTEDMLAHQMEHSIEVQLPFILYFTRSVGIVPITMMPVSMDTCSMVGEALAAVIKGADEDITIIASSDMSHYVTDADARIKDKMAIDRILARDPEGLYNTVRDEGISMCGVIPVTTMLFAANSLGATETSLVKYMTSGEVSGDYEHVVGYAGIIVK